MPIELQVYFGGMYDVAADGVSSDPGLQCGKGEIHDDGGVSGHRSALGLVLSNRKRVKCEILEPGLQLALVRQ
ncbi:hypothetical protein MUG91_G4208n1 [Manis pentadactyla]|nr:hypothetical protein MUG91_G4208n1 [Manis pentadactyla]